jgi:hypothetical protein
MSVHFVKMSQNLQLEFACVLCFDKTARLKTLKNLQDEFI